MACGRISEQSLAAAATVQGVHLDEPVVLAADCSARKVTEVRYAPILVVVPPYLIGMTNAASRDPHVRSISWPSDQSVHPPGTSQYILAMKGAPLAQFIRDPGERVINLTAGICLLYAGLERIVLSSIPAFFPHASDVGLITSEVCIAYFAAWILYYLVTWRPSYISRQAAAVIVAGQVFRLVASASQMSGMLSTAADRPRQLPLTKEELHEICASVTLRQSSVITISLIDGKQTSVLMAVHRYVNDAMRAAPRVLELLPYFDRELVLRVAAIQTSGLATMIEPLVPLESLISTDLTLESYEDDLRAFLHECDQLWAWICNRYPDAVREMNPDLLEDRTRVPQFDLA